MADTLQSRVTSPVADDDPFAELTRIMGFDPREPVSRPKATADVRAPLDAPQADHHGSAAGANDLEIDLERELMGEFSDDALQRDAWDVGADGAEDADRQAEAVEAEDRRADTDAWVRPGSNDAPAAHAEEQSVSDRHEAPAASSGDDWDVDLAADLLAGVDHVAEPEVVAAQGDSWSDAEDRAEDAAADHEWTHERPRVASAAASPDAFVSEVDLPPIPLSRSAQAEADAPAASDEAGLDLALEHELGAVLADPVEAGGWDEAVDDRHAGQDVDHSAFAASIGTAEDAADPHDPVEDGDRSFEDRSSAAGGYDPYAALAALSAGLHAAPGPQESASDRHPERVGKAAAASEVPDIETVEVPERGVPVADELDIPEIHFEDQSQASTAYDDIDAEFANLLNEMNSMDRAPAATAPPSAWQAVEPDEPQGRPIVVPAAAGESGRRYAVDADYFASGRGDHQTDLADMEFAFDPDAPEDMAPPALASRRPRSRGYLVAAALAGVAVLGGVAVFLLPFGGGEDSSEIALVQADPSPVKVRPENPGGVVIPNQDNRVYDRVAGAGGNETPTQEKLLQSAEEPIELPMPRDEDLTDLAPFPGDIDGALAKAEDRVAPTAPEEGVDTTMEVAAVPPRKVRTMIVKADGTLVAREVPVQDAGLAAEDGMATALDPIASATTAAEADAALPADEPIIEPAVEAAAEQPVVPADAPLAAAPATDTASTPAAAPIAPSRPSDQPVDIVGEVRPNQQVAALAPAAAGAWSMQIASQPSEASAQASYRDLQRRYGKVLDGRQANIVKADIPGKGTFWRVRVPAGTRAEAVKLCETYKAAGGSCFVSK